MAALLDGKGCRFPLRTRYREQSKRHATVRGGCRTPQHAPAPKYRKPGYLQSSTLQLRLHIHTFLTFYIHNLCLSKWLTKHLNESFSWILEGFVEYHARWQVRYLYQARETQWTVFAMDYAHLTRAATFHRHCPRFYASTCTNQSPASE